MIKRFSALLVAVLTGQPALAQDQPITAASTRITVLTRAYEGNTVDACSSFPVTSIMSSITQTLNIGSQSTGAGAGKVTFNPFTIAKYPDSCSPTLFMQAAAGIPFQEVIAVVETGGANGKPYLPVFLIRLGLAAVASLDDSASDGSKILEKVTFDYGDLTIAKYDQSATGALGGFNCAGWNRVNNSQDTSNCSELQTVAQDRINGKVR